MQLPVAPHSRITNPAAFTRAMVLSPFVSPRIYHAHASTLTTSIHSTSQARRPAGTHATVRQQRLCAELAFPC